MSQIQFVAYLSDSDTGSAQFRAAYGQLPASQQSLFKLLDFHEVKRTIGSRCPKWLRGFPTLATYEATPSVWEGQLAITYVQQLAAKASQSAAAPPQRADSSTLSVRNLVDHGAEFLAQSTDGEFGRTGAVVSDSLYQSHMANKAGGGSQRRGKVTADDIAAFNSARDSMKGRGGERGSAF
jgi:hypothetical protein